MDLWPSQSLIHAMDVLFVFSIYFSVGLHSRIQIFMMNNWCKAGLKFSMENSVNLLILWLKGHGVITGNLRNAFILLDFTFV